MLQGRMHHRRDRTVVSRAQHLEAVRQLLDRIAVTDPHLAVVGHTFEQFGTGGTGLCPVFSLSFANPYSLE